MLKLYHYWRSSSSWRVRWALVHKKIEAKFIHVNLLNGESESPEHLARNPLGYVPVLETDGSYLIESVAIIEFLDEKFLDMPLFPKNIFEKAYVRSLIGIIGSDIQPVQNLTVLDKYSEDAEKRKSWSQYFIERGFDAYERLCERTAGQFSLGDTLTAADIFLIPQVYNANRFDVSMKPYPNLLRINENASKLAACINSSPEKFAP